MGYIEQSGWWRQAVGYWSLYPPSQTTTDDLYLFANLTDTRPYIALLGNSGVQIRLAAAAGFNLYDSSTQALEIKYESANNHVLIMNKIDAKDLYLATTGTGVIKFGTFTADATVTQAGYITIKDAGGTTRYLSCITP